MIIIDKNAKREVQVKYPDRTRVLFPNLDDGYISSNDIVVPGINAPISDDGIAVATINDGAEGGAISKLVIGIEPVQSGTGDPSPDNVRPISGWTQAKVSQSGKNLCEATRNNSFITEVRANQTYTLSLKNAGRVGVNIKKDSSSGRNLATTGDAVSTELISLTFTPTEDCSVYLNGWSDMPGQAFNKLTSDYQLELGSTATAYEPYTADTYTIDLDGTRYGGTLDVTTGVLTVDRVIKNSGFTRGSVDSSGKLYPIGGADNCVTYEADNVADCISNYGVFESLNGLRTTNNKNFCCYNRNFFVGGYVDDEASLDTMLQSLQIVYPLSSPLTIQLTPQEVTTLLGQNNIWADCGDVLELSYSANLNLRVQDLLNEKLDKPTIPGTLGQVLTSDGEGGQTWETPE